MHFDKSLYMDLRSRGEVGKNMKLKGCFVL